MGAYPDRTGKAAQDGHAAWAAATSQVTAQAVPRLVIQVHRCDGAERSTVETKPPAAGSGYFLILLEANEPETGAPFSGIAIDATALADQCPRWRQFAFQAIPADAGLGAMVRSHLSMLTAQSANIDSTAAMSMASVTVGLVAALLNSLDGRVANEPVSLPAFHRRRIKDFVLNNLCNPSLDIDMIADAVGLSERYIHHLFADEPASLMQWIITKRLVHCHGQLVDPKRRHWKISRIAYDAGFNDLAHFSRSFRKHFDISPSQARSGVQ